MSVYLHTRAICDACDAPASIEMDTGFFLCEACAAIVIDSVTSASVASCVDVKATAGAMSPPTPASAVAVNSNSSPLDSPREALGPSLATGMSRDPANAGGKDDPGLTALLLNDSFENFGSVSGTSPGACGTERERVGATNSGILLQGADRLVSKPDGNRTPCVLSGRQPPSICRGERRPTRLGEQQTDLSEGIEISQLKSAVGVTAGETAINSESRACEGNGSNADGSKTADGSARYSSCGDGESRPVVSAALAGRPSNRRNVADPRGMLPCRHAQASAAGIASGPQDSNSNPATSSLVPETCGAVSLDEAAPLSLLPAPGEALGDSRLGIDFEDMVAALESEWLAQGISLRNSETLRTVAPSRMASNDVSKSSSVARA